jgi:hypothetical protein
LSDIAGSWHGEAHQDDTAPCRQSRRLGKFTEVLVEREKNAFIASGPRQDLSIGTPRRDRPDPNDIVPSRDKSGNCCAGKILVSEEAHIKPRSDILVRC